MLPQTVHKLSCGTGTSPQAPGGGCSSVPCTPVSGHGVSWANSSVFIRCLSVFSHMLESSLWALLHWWRSLFWNSCLSSISVYETVRIPPNIYRCTMVHQNQWHWKILKAGPKCRTPFLAARCPECIWMLYVRTCLPSTERHYWGNFRKTETYVRIPVRMFRIEIDTPYPNILSGCLSTSCTLRQGEAALHALHRNTVLSGTS